MQAMGSVIWRREVAEVYARASSAMFDDAVVEPAVELLTELAGGRALEFAVGTGGWRFRCGHAATRSPGSSCRRTWSNNCAPSLVATRSPVVVGDMPSATAAGDFALVYLVYDTIMKVTTQDEQVAVFENAAAHLEPGGRFVVEVVVPQVRRLPPGERARIFSLQADHVGFETFDDLVG